MLIKELEISQLNPAEYNPRTISADEFKGLKASLKKYGLVEPIVVNKDNTIIGGHMRTKAWESLGHDTIPCYVVDLDKHDEKKLNVLLNSQAISGKYDDIKLEGILQDLKLDDDFKELRLDQLAALDLSDEVQEDDFEQPKEAKYTVEVGDVFQLGEHRLMCGDSTKIEDVEKLMNGDKADMVFTDPPYGIEIVDKKTRKVGAENLAKNQEYSEVIGDDTTDTARDFYNTFVSLGYNRFVIWGGNYFTQFLPFSDGWIVWDKRGEMTSNNFADGEMAWCSFHTRVRIYKQVWNGMIREGESEKRVHPTQKPIRMLGEIINDFTKEGESIVDVFGGSGSTLMACEQLNRRCYMMELDPHYVSVIIERWEKLTEQQHVKIL